MRRREYLVLNCTRLLISYNANHTWKPGSGLHWDRGSSLNCPRLQDWLGVNSCVTVLLEQTRYCQITHFTNGSYSSNKQKKQLHSSLSRGRRQGLKAITSQWRQQLLPPDSSHLPTRSTKKTFSGQMHCTDKSQERLLPTGANSWWKCTPGSFQARMELIHSTIRGFGLLKFYAAQSETHQSDAFNFRGLLDWGGEGGASINLPVVWRKCYKCKW